MTIHEQLLIELAWAAGLFEGEGTVRINRATKRNLGHLMASVVNTDRDVVDFFQSRWPGYMKPATGLDPTRQRPAWVWVVAARKAADFIRAIRPFIVRRAVIDKFECALAFQDGKRIGRAARTLEYREAQFSAYLWMRELNVRGVQS